MYRSIQYARAVAAISVVLFHASYVEGFARQLLPSGVDLFFVISGFVMVVSAAGMAPGAFLAKCARRIVPMWWVTLLLAAALGLVEVDSNWLKSAFPIPEGYRFGGAGKTVWSVGWTLVFEALFYAIFAVGLAVRSQRFAVLSILVLVAAGFMLGRTGIPLLDNAMHAFMLEFLIGMRLAHLVVRVDRLPLWLLPLGTVALTIACLVGIPYAVRPVLLALPLACLLAGVIEIERRGLLPDLKVLGFLGDASYSMYLLHNVALALLWRVIPPHSWWLLTGGAAVAFGCASYVLVEKPMLKRSQPAKALPAGA